MLGEQVEVGIKTTVQAASKRARLHYLRGSALLAIRGR
jgi:hypothetical protein